MARLVGEVLHYQLGVWDSWLAYRINKMVDKGILEVTEEAENGRFYECRLRKVLEPLKK